MTRSLFWRGLVAFLFLTGVCITEAQLYADYGTDPGYTMNVNFIAAVIIAGAAALCLIYLSLGRDLGGGVTALVLGSVQALIFLQSQDPAFFTPPLLEAAAGLAAIVVYGYRVDRAERPRPGVVRPP